MSTLQTSKLASNFANNWSIDISPDSYLYSPGMVLQTVYIRADAQATYSSPNSGDGTAISALDINITPKRADSLLLCTWMINGEVHWNNVFLVHKNGSLITTTGFEAYNNEVGNLRYSGVMSAFYDNDNSTTMSNYFMRYAIPAESTSPATYTPAVRASGATAYTFYLNRTINTAGSDAREISVSTGMIQEIAQ